MIITKSVDLTDSTIQQILSGLTGNLPECSESVACTRYKYDEFEFSFFDEEDGKKYTVEYKGLVEGLRLLLTQEPPLRCIQQIPVTNDPDAWDDWLCAVDADATDALVQFTLFKELVYG